MGVLSKPQNYALKLIAYYLTELYLNPVQTKSVTSCLMASLANYISQVITHGELRDRDGFLAFGAFGLLFGGTIPHYFYKMVSGFLSQNSRNPLLHLLLIERLVFMPAFSFFTLYMLSRLVGSKHEPALDKALVAFPAVVQANWKYLTLLHFINIYFVPPMLRVLFSNLIAFFWIIVLSIKRQNKQHSKVD